MAVQSMIRRQVFSLALGVLVLGGALVAAQEMLRLARNVPGDSKPILLYADAVTTWTEGGQRVILLTGKVLAEQGVVHVRAQRAVAWVDEEHWRRTRIQHLDLYVEGDVHLENGAESRSGPKALVELNTRGELKLKAQGSKVAQQSRIDDPLYVRAKVERFPPDLVLPATAVQRTSAREAVSVPPPPSPAVGPAPAPPAPPPAPRLPTLQTPIYDPSQSLPGPGPPPPPAAPPPSTHGPSLQPVPLTGPALPAPMPGTLPGSVPEAPGPIADAPPRIISIRERTSAPYQAQSFPLPTGEQAILITGGVIVTVRNLANLGLIDIEADRLILWSRGNTQELFQGMRGSQGQTSKELEFYLSGNVEIRQQEGPVNRTLRAEQIYYDVNRNVAVAVSADVEFKQPGLPDPIHLRADELLQLSTTQFKAVRAEVFTSRLPSDPGIKVYVTEATVDEKRIPRRSIFGRQVVNRQTGLPETEPQRIFRGRNMFLEVEDVPIFYLPFIQGDVEDPLGPLEQFRFSHDRVFGSQVYTTFNGYDLFGLDPLAGTRWRLDVDYLSKRGPALGTDFDYFGNDLFDVPSRYTGLIKAWGLNDDGRDILGGGRGEAEPHPDWRGRFLWRQNWWELPAGFTVQTQASLLSDKNFFEQFYKQEFDLDIDQETFAYVKQQQNNWAWTLLAEPRLRDWVTETEWLPKGDGYLIGQSFFELLTYNVHASAGYAQLRPTEEPPPPILPTDVRVDTGRFDLWQDLSLPFNLGAVRLVPYGVLDLTHYTEDRTGADTGRLYGGGGGRASLPLSRLYPEAQSDLFNLNGINHKIVLSGNYFNVHSDTPFGLLPQLDRLDDDATDQARRGITPRLPAFNPRHGRFLATSPLFNPQIYAIRRLVDNRVDTLDTIEVLQADLRQRWQTKRGYPGMQHIIDWMTLDLSASYFPDSNRDNFGEDFAFLEYDWTWNIGDRTALTSSGWYDPIDDGARLFAVGAHFNRPDRTSLFLGYRQIDPLESRAVTGAVSYVFSPKYAVTGSSTFDFGVNQHHSLSNGLTLTRMGSDLQVSLGFTYNALQNNFGMTFELLPNLVPANRRFTSGQLLGSNATGPFPGMRGR